MVRTQKEEGGKGGWKLEEEEKINVFNPIKRLIIKKSWLHHKYKKLISSIDCVGVKIATFWYIGNMFTPSGLHEKIVGFLLNKRCVFKLLHKKFVRFKIS